MAAVSQDPEGGPSEVAAPVLRVITPNATPEEVAALVAVFSALGSGSTPAAPRPRSWNAPRRQVRRTHRHGVDGWRASGLPS